VINSGPREPPKNEKEKEEKALSHETSSMGSSN
jgi:hypothetical protein